MRPKPAPHLQPDGQADAGNGPASAGGEELDPAAVLGEPQAPPCVMCFNAQDASGAAGLPADVCTVAAMGAHALPVLTSVVMRDTADVFDHSALDADDVAEQARTVLEDITVGGFKVGFLGSPEAVSAVAEVLADYPDVPLVAHLPNLNWLEEPEAGPYLEAFGQLILPAAELLVGSHKALQDFLLPDWDSERPPSARELAVAAGERGTGHVLVTGILLPVRNNEQFIDNILASPEGAIAGEKFEMFEASFVGAGDTLSAAIAALLASGADLMQAVSEALTFLDHSLNSGYRPGMGHVVPDRFFWAGPPPDEQELEPGAQGQAGGSGPAASPDASPVRGGPPGGRGDRGGNGGSGGAGGPGGAGSSGSGGPAPGRGGRGSRASKAAASGGPAASAATSPEAPADGSKSAKAINKRFH